MTDDLLSKIESDPVLSKAFKDPEMSRVLAMYQANPQQALAATKDKPEVFDNTVIHVYTYLRNP